MTERERLASNARRLEWLADARFGPARIATPPPSDAPTRRRRVALPRGVWRHRLAGASVLGRRIRDFESGSTLLPPEPDSEPIRYPSRV